MKTTDYQPLLEHIREEIEIYAKEGKQADYIPALANVDPDQFGLSLHMLDGRTYSIGASDVKFSIQSIAKVFSLAIALSILGKDLWTRIGKEPSGSAFNSLVQLEYEHGKPRNPFINAGALVTADVILSHLENPKEFFLRFVRTIAGNEDINFSEEVAQSELSCSYLNASIAYLLKHHGNLHNDVNDVLQFYSTICSLEMSCEDLSHAFMAFARSNEPFSHAGVNLTISRVKRINAIKDSLKVERDKQRKKLEEDKERKQQDSKKEQPQNDPAIRVENEIKPQSEERRRDDDKDHKPSRKENDKESKKE